MLPKEKYLAWFVCSYLDHLLWINTTVWCLCALLPLLVQPWHRSGIGYQFMDKVAEVGTTRSIKLLHPLLVPSPRSKLVTVGSLVFGMKKTWLHLFFKTPSDALACDQIWRLFILHVMGFLSNLVLNNECSVIGVALSKISAVDCLQTVFQLQTVWESCLKSVWWLYISAKCSQCSTGNR